MAREDLHFRLRIPEDLKKKVEKAAETNHRSMTAEIIARLEASMSEQTNAQDAKLEMLRKEILDLRNFLMKTTR